MNLRCCGILINQYPLPGIMNLEYLLVDPKMASEARELFTVTTSIHTASGQKWFGIPSQKEIPTGMLLAVVTILTTGMFPAKWAAPYFQFYSQSPTLVGTLDSRSVLVGVSNALVVLHNHDYLH